MKHFKLFFALFAMLALGVGNAWGAEAKFGTDWNSVFGTSYSGNISSVKANTLTLSGTVNSVSLVATNGTSTNGYVKTSDWRLYDGYTLTLTAPANHNITAISAKKGGKTITGISTTVGDLSIPSGGATMSWTGSSNQVVFKVTATMGFSEITVTYSEGSGSTPTPDPEDPEPDPDPEPGPGGEETWTLVTNASNLKVGDQIVIAAKGSDYALGTTQNTKNRDAVSVTKGTNTITIGNDVQIITLETGNTANTFAFNTGSGYLYAASSSENLLKTQSILNDNGSWAISITSEGVATIKAQGTNTRNLLKKNSQSALFSCYGSGQSDVAIYKKVTSSGETPEKQQAGLAYEEKEHTANVGEDFTEPTLTNPNRLTVTYSSSNTAFATVDPTTGEVSILAAGKVTITASSAADATYAAGSASYNITISDPSLAVAQLPFTFNSGKADIEKTAGMTQNGLGSNYSASTAPNSQLKFDGTGDWVIIHFNGQAEKLAYEIKGNDFSGGKFTVQQSADGSTYTDVVTYTELGDAATKEHKLAAESRYVKFIYTEKSLGNVGLGNIKIALPEEPEERLTDWVLTPLADITTNDLVVITMTKGETTWAMTNDKGTSAAPVASVVTLSADALAAEPDANLKWVVSNDNGTLTIYPYGTYETWLYCTNANNGVRVGTGEAKEFTINTDHLYTTLTNESRYLGVYDADTWRCYTSINSNIEDQTLAFYVKKNANDVLPEGGEGGEDPVVPTPTVNPTATFVFNTADGLAKLGIAYPTTPDGDSKKTNIGNNTTVISNGVGLTMTGGTKTATRVWLTASGVLDLRVYQGATLTFAVADGFEIIKVDFEGSELTNLAVDDIPMTDAIWEGNQKSVTFENQSTVVKINTIAVTVAYTRDVTLDEYGTICIPYASSSYSGAKFYEVSWLKTDAGLYLDELAADAALEAGKPYIFFATSTEIKVTCTGDAVADPVEGENGLTGTFEDIADGDAALLGNYIIAQNQIWVAGANNSLPANRAYIDKDGVPTTEQPKLAGRRRVCMGENAATGLDNITNGENTTIKVIENGQLIIIRNGEKFNAQGQKL